MIEALEVYFWSYEIGKNLLENLVSDVSPIV